MSATTASLLDLALGYVRGGLSLVPCSTRDKRPLMALLPRDPSTNKPTWKPYQDRIADEPTVRDWFARGCQSVAAIGGPISGGLVVIDIDAPRLYEPWRAAVGTLADGLCVQRTGRGNYQVWFRCPEPGSSDKLAWVPAADDETGRTIGIETKATNGYAIAPGSLHPNGNYYEALEGDFAAVPLIPQAQADALLAAARKLDEMPMTKQEMEAAAKAQASTEHRRDSNGQANVIDQFNERFTIREMLEKHNYKPAGCDRYIRPGGSRPLTLVLDNRRSVHFSSDDPLYTGERQSRDAFAVFAYFEHGNDTRAAVKAAAELLGLKPLREHQSKSPAVANYEAIKGGDGKSKRVALSMQAIIERTAQLTGDWPRRVNDALFVHDPEHGIGWLETPSALFGFYARRVGRVAWQSGITAVRQGELFAELRRTAKRYVNVEDLPHEPMFPNHYYACPPIEPGDGATIQRFLDRFAPATDVDRDLMLAAAATPLWGGPPGCRPCFIITSDDGRGVGKSTVAARIGELYGEVITFSHNEDIDRIKTRLLSPQALPKRVALLDNVKSLKFSWAELEAMITATAIGGHRMYAGEAVRPNTLTWFVTLNGASLSTDLAQRAVVIKVVRPERSDTWEEDTRLFVRQNRLGILADLVAFLRSERFPLSRFSRWATWEKDVLQRLPEPAEAQKVILERQGEADVEEEEIEILEDFFAGQLQHFGYHPERERVFIPTRIAARWYGWATNQPAMTSGGAGRIIMQIIKEGRSKRLTVNARHAWGRGFVWVGEHANPITPTSVDLASRIGQETTQKNTAP